MSVSGYVSEGYRLCIYDENDKKIKHKHNELIEKVAISARNSDKTRSEISVPCIVKKRRYQVKFKINKQALEAIIPNPDKISLEFYSSKSAQSPATKLEVTTYGKSPLVITQNTIKATYNFKTPEGFHSSKDSEFIYIALRVHKHLIKYIACDIAVFTHTSQISPNYDLVLGDTGKSHILELFWFNDASFISKESAAQLKAEKKLNEEDEVASDKKPLLTLIQATESAVKEMRELLKCDNSNYEERLTQIVKNINTVYDQNRNQPETPSISETHFFPFEEPLFTPMPFDSLDWMLLNE
jgi:hypothetical protein